MKKTLSIILSIVMIFTALPLTAIPSFAITSGTTGDCTWALDGTVLTISGNGAMANYNRFNDKDAPWGKAITEVIIEDGVTNIGVEAFFNCTSLKSVTIPNSVTSIGQTAFFNCASLKNVTIPESVTELGKAVFSDCTSLESAEIPNSVTTKLYETFENCESLKSVLLGSGIPSIDYCSFSGCISLESITIPDSVTKIGIEAFSECISLINVKIPESVTAIEGNAFQYCESLESIELPNNLQTICEGAFDSCLSLTKIVVPDSVTHIDKYVFDYCPSLTEINVNSKNEYYSSENGVLFNKDKTVLMQYPIGNDLTEYTIPNGVTSINGDAFYGCEKLKSLIIPDSLTSIDEYAFAGCFSLVSITIPDNVKTIGKFAFDDCKSLESIIIPKNVAKILDLAFYDCTSLKSITILGSDTYIGNKAIGYYTPTNHWEELKIDDIIIYGEHNSKAESYAKRHKFTFVSINNTEITFPDVAKGEWYYDAIKFNVQQGYFHGYQNGTFGPGDNIQRQDFVVVLANIAGADLSSYQGKNGNMPDVPKNDYYSAAVAWAVDNHIINGYSNGKFGVGDPITREQVCVIFYNYFKNYLNEDVSLSKSENTILSKFNDKNSVSDWAVTPVSWAVENGVISGTNGGIAVSPAGNANRAQIAQIIYNMSSNGLI